MELNAISSREKKKRKQSTKENIKRRDNRNCKDVIHSLNQI